MKIFMDVDDVLADFVGGMCRLHDKENPYAEPLDTESAGVWEIEKLLGLTVEEFWTPAGGKFWGGLELMPDGKSILSLAENAVGAENVCLLTTPPLNPESASGKIWWIERCLPNYNRRFLIGPPKQFCAHKDAILIDDADHNVDAFVKAGGKAILVPRAWNSAWRYRNDVLSYVQNKLDMLNPDTTTTDTAIINPGFTAILSEIQALHDKKSKDYGTDVDPLAAVRACEEYGLPAWIGVQFRLDDKRSRIKNAIKSTLAGEKVVMSNESLEDSLVDRCAYTIIALQLYREGVVEVKPEASDTPTVEVG